jgi:hypothetical protein
MSSGGTAGQSGGGHVPNAGQAGDGVGEGGGAGEPAGDGASAARVATCNAFCAKLAGLPCPPDPDACFHESCEFVMYLPPECVPQYDAMLTCEAAAPLDGFMCNGDMASVRDETCAAEQAAWVACASE